MYFLIKSDELWEKYEDIWNVIKNKLGIKFHSEPIYGKKYLKAKVREFDGDIKTNFLSNDLPKKKYVLYLHCLHNYWFCFKNEQKNYAQVYLEECKYKIKKIQKSRFINVELESDLESEAEEESKYDTAN